MFPPQEGIFHPGAPVSAAGRALAPFDRSPGALKLLSASCCETLALSGCLSQPWCEPHQSNPPRAEFWLPAREGGDRREKGRRALALPVALITTASITGELWFLPLSLVGARAPWCGAASWDALSITGMRGWRSWDGSCLHRHVCVRAGPAPAQHGQGLPLELKVRWGDKGLMRSCSLSLILPPII